MTTEAAERTTPILPDVSVELIGQDGNAFNILGLVTRAMKRAGHGDRVEEFRTEATSGDYDHLLQTCMKWVSVGGPAAPLEDEELDPEDEEEEDPAEAEMEELEELAEEAAAEDEENDGA